MEPLTLVSGLAAPLARDNVDTDAILPKQFMKSIARTGFGPKLFDAWRYLDIGEPGQDHAARPRNPEFVLNLQRYAGAPILLAGRNFGCGSSREHAVWALMQHGFRVVIAPGFADIFKQNSIKNGLLPVALDEVIMARLFAQAAGENGCRLRVDLERQTVTDGDGTQVRFEIVPFARHCLLNGLDEIGLTLQQCERIARFEQQRLARYPWLATPAAREGA